MRAALGATLRSACCDSFLFRISLLITVFIMTIIILTTLTFRGGSLWVAVAEASGEMDQDPLPLLGLTHQWKSL